MKPKAAGLRPRRVKRYGVLLIADDPVLRQGVRRMIEDEPDLSVCAEVNTPEAALRAIQASSPCLAMLDLSLGSASWLGLVRQLRQAAPTLPILVLSRHDEALFAERSLQAGARGYFVMREPVDALRRAIRQLLGGSIYVSENLLRYAPGVTGRSGATDGDGIAGLTDRELRVFEMIGLGASSAAIAARLGVEVKTVETYRSNIRAKLGLDDPAQLVRCATRWSARI